MSTATGERTAVSTWNIDSAHSNVEFSVKHPMISTVKGQFSDVDGSVDWDGSDFSTATVEANIAVESITTFNEQRDQHLRTNDFFAVEDWPAISFKSNRIEPDGEDDFKIYGNLSIRDVTRPVVLDTEFEGMVDKDAFGKARAAFTATTQINRKEFGVNWNQALEAGGFLVGDKVKVTLHIALVR